MMGDRYQLRTDVLKCLTQDQLVALVLAHGELVFEARFHGRTGGMFHERTLAREAAHKARMLVAAFGERSAQP